MKIIGVTELKSKLLEVVRDVARGGVYTVTRDGREVARLIPIKGSGLPATHFANVEIVGDITSPLDERWCFDSDNLPPKSS